MIAMNFKQLNLPSFDLLREIDHMLSENQIGWGPIDQICINTPANKINDIHYGAGSLYFDWNNIKNGKPGIRSTELKETDFTELCSVFSNTAFEEVYKILKNQFNIGRLRLMKSIPKTCLTWHCDDTKRIHYPISTQDGCLMIIEDEVKHLPANTWWLTNTLVKHTALNASAENRIHLVVSLLDEDS
jgi:hypothetical protein